MKRALLILLVAIVSLPSLASERRTYAKLDKLFRTDVKKCLVKSKKLIKKKPDVASPYYFACQIFLGKEEKAKTPMAKYRSLKAAIGYAKKFDAKANEGFKHNVEWLGTIHLIEKKVTAVSSALIASQEYAEYTEVLINKFVELVPTEDIAKNDELELSPYLSINSSASEATDVELSSESTMADVESAPEVGLNNNMFTGMPTGFEMVPSSNPASEIELMKLINEERLKKGMGALEWDENLARAARYHAADLGVNNYFDHDSHDMKNGKLVKIGGTFERIRLFYHDSFANSENIAAGNATPEETYQQWYESKGHNENMFNSSSTKVGIGYYHVPGSTYGHYWVFCTAH